MSFAGFARPITAVVDFTLGFHPKMGCHMVAILVKSLDFAFPGPTGQNFYQTATKNRKCCLTRCKPARESKKAGRC